MNLDQSGLAPEGFLVLLGILRVGFRLSLGIYFFFQGFNGLFSLIPIPPPKPSLAYFLKAFETGPYFLSSVKIGQILCGLCLLLNQSVGLALVLLGILVFGIVQLQWHLNENKKLAVFIGALYGITFFLHFKEITGLL
jgi:hypothetical protein